MQPTREEKKGTDLQTHRGLFLATKGRFFALRGNLAIFASNGNLEFNNKICVFIIKLNVYF